MKVVEYAVLRANTVTELTRNIRLALEDGFQPIGGIAVGEMRFYQSIVKYEDGPVPVRSVSTPNNYSEHPCN